MDTIYRIDMSIGKVAKEEVAGDYEGLGGRGLTSAIVSKEVIPTCHPLDAHNKLVIAPGLLTGTSAPCSGRLSIGAKSPLTGGIKESNAGGVAGQKLGRLGIAAIVVEGKPTDGKLYALELNKDSAKLIPADDLKGLGNYDTVARLTEKYGGKVGYISIGPAGEMKMSAASVAVTDSDNHPTRHAGRGGMGAVMGSKGLKVIIADDSEAGRPPIKDRDSFNAAAKKFAQLLQQHPTTSETLPTYGTNALANVINEAGGYPTRNFSAGRFERTDSIGGETQREITLERGGLSKHACHPGCVIGCSSIYNDKDGNFLTKGPEYETVWANGANCGIDDFDAIARMDRMYDDYGLDTIELGNAIAVAMEAGVKEFGDADGAIELIHEVGKGTPLGRILGNGAKVTGQAFGVTRVPVVKGQAMPAYDPRAAKGIGVTYATSTMGADHTSGYAIAQNILKVGGDVDPLKPDGQVDLSRDLQIATAVVDTVGLCLFIAFCTLDMPEALDAVIDMVNAEYGLSLDGDDVVALGKKVLKMERGFNEAAGFTSKDDRLPLFFKEEKLSPHNVVFDVSDEELDSLFNF